MTLSRRDFAQVVAALAATTAAPALAQNASGGDTKQSAPATPAGEAAHDMAAFPPHWHGAETIVFLAYQGFTALDLVGPHYMLSALMGAKTIVVAKSIDPVVSDAKLTIVPDATFADCPADIDVLCVPGGTAGTLAAMRDDATISFLKDRGSRARFITSVCTGSLVLGAAGLLRGYKATSHWVTREVLREFGAEPVDARVVVDRNRVTGAGVTAGIDFGLDLVAKLRDNAYAQGMQLLAEYDPKPSFNAGSPATAPRETTAMLSTMFESFVADTRQAARDAMVKLRG